MIKNMSFTVAPDHAVISLRGGLTKVVILSMPIYNGNAVVCMISFYLLIFKLLVVGILTILPYQLQSTQSTTVT